MCHLAKEKTKRLDGVLLRMERLYNEKNDEELHAVLISWVESLFTLIFLEAESNSG